MTTMIIFATLAVLIFVMLLVSGRYANRQCKKTDDISKRKAELLESYFNERYK